MDKEFQTMQAATGKKRRPMVDSNRRYTAGRAAEM